MTFRPGQSGSVFEKGKCWVGRYYIDIPGTLERRRVKVTLGPLDTMTKTQARRKLRLHIDSLGLNQDKHLERVSASRTFREEAEWWRDNKLSNAKESTQEVMTSHLDKYLMPRFGDLPLDLIDERRAQELIAELRHAEYVTGKKRKGLTPKSVRNIIGVLKLIIGKKARDWELALPVVPRREQRYFTEDEMRALITGSTGQWKVIWATLASTGLRCGEAFGLHVEDIDFDMETLTVRRSVWKGREVTPKSDAGYRVVNMDTVLVEMLKHHLNGRRTGRVFQTKNGTPFAKGNVRRKLRETLTKLNLPLAGLHAFRHGRVSVLRKSGVPNELIKEWVGHSSLSDVTPRYTHFDTKYRRETVNSLGLIEIEK